MVFLDQPKKEEGLISYIEDILYNVFREIIPRSVIDST